jgi:predicted esterase
MQAAWISNTVERRQRAPRVSKALAACAFFTLCLASARDVRAQTSGGSGGPLGEQTDWPCPGCLFGTPLNYDPNTPAPVLVTFHGDEGSPSYIHRSYYGTERARGPAFDSGLLVLSLQCPRELGCADADPDGQPSWWRWRSSTSYDAAWVGQQVDKVQAAYDVALRNVYLASFSGGSSFLRRYAFENADRFAGAIISGGGGEPARQCLTTCKIPIFISIGSVDFLYDNAQQTRAYCERCGHEVNYSEHPGIDHTIIREDLPVALDWLLQRPHPCIAPPPPAGTGGSGGGGALGAGGQAGGVGSGGGSGAGGSGIGAGGSSTAGAGATPAAGGPGVEPGSGAEGDEAGCACRTGRQKPSDASLALVVLAFGLLGFGRSRARQENERV